MNSSGYLPVSETAVRPSVRAKAQRKPRRGKRMGKAVVKVERALPAVGTLGRTKSLLLAALRVWELKQKLNE